MANIVEQEFTPMFGIGEPNDAFAAYFAGNSYINPLASGEVIVTNVTFEPGCRNNWHIHYGGHQILIVTDGSGWFQEEGKVAQKLTPGTVVDIEPGVKHWHGAATDCWMSHVVISVPSDEARTEWLEPVNQKNYEALWATFAGLERY